MSPAPPPIRRRTRWCCRSMKGSQIQALGGTQPGLPLKLDCSGIMTHDYKRPGKTTLFAALDVLDGTMIARGMQRHRHEGFIRVPNAVER